MRTSVQCGIRAILLGAALAVGPGGRAACFDLTGLQDYAAQTPNVHGVVRIHDSELTQPLVHLWQDRFLKLHPLVRYKEYTVPAWFNGLCADTADLAVAGRRAYLTELKAFESIYGYPMTEIVFATGGVHKPEGNTTRLVNFFPQDKPLTGPPPAPPPRRLRA